MKQIIMEHVTRKSTWFLKFRSTSFGYLHMKKVVSHVKPRSRLLLKLGSTVSSVAARSSVESISARYCRFMIMLSAPGSRWASAIPTPTYVCACTRNRRVAWWHTCMYASSPEFHQTRDLVIYRDLWTTVHPSPSARHPPPPHRSYWLYPFPLSMPRASLTLSYEMNLQLSILLDFYRLHTGIEPHLTEEVDWAGSKSIWLESFTDRHVFSISRR